VKKKKLKSSSQVVSFDDLSPSSLQSPEVGEEVFAELGPAAQAPSQQVEPTTVDQPATEIIHRNESSSSLGKSFLQ
jgi:hypothetical protein